MSVISFALPGMRAEWGLVPADLGLVLPAVGVGQLLGAIVVGSLADRFGRRLAFCSTSMMAGAGTGLAGLAPNPLLLGVALFFGGLGYGGVAPVAGALVSEFAPAAHRGRLLGFTQVLWTLGWSAAAIGGGWFARQLGWRGILGLGGLPIGIGLLGLLLVPESPRFLFSRGRHADALALAGRLSERHGVEVPLGMAPHVPWVASPLGHLIELWRPPFRRRTVALWITWVAMNAAFTGPIVWLTLLLADLGSLGPRVTAFVGFMMFPAALTSTLLIERTGRRPLILGSLSLAGVGALVMAAGPGAVWVAMGAAAVAMGTLAAWPVVLAWASELYPTRMRGTAGGWASGCARFGGILAPAVVGLLLSPAGEGRLLAMLPFAALLFAAVAGIALLSEETTGRTLEELSR